MLGILIQLGQVSWAAMGWFTNFHTKALSGEDIAVYGDGEQMRSFGYVGDAVDCTIALMENNDAVGEVYNIGNEGKYL